MFRQKKEPIFELQYDLILRGVMALACCHLAITLVHEVLDCACEVRVVIRYCFWNAWPTVQVCLYVIGELNLAPQALSLVHTETNYIPN